MKFERKDILGIKDLSVDEINLILEMAGSFLEVSTRKIKKVPTLRGKTVINLFYEASTRTRTSFEIAGKRLSADTINISSSTSSVMKGETLIDTARNLEAMNPDVIVIRHSAAGAPHLLASLVKQSIINAGDGAHEHPSQALLDMMTIKERKGNFPGLKVAIIGDIEHSRVVRSNIYGLSKMGATVVVAGPATMLPRDIEQMGVKVFDKMEDAITDADVVMMLRIQLERQKQNIFPSLREYSQRYCLNRNNIKLAKKDVIVMHPGPINRGVELSPDIADDPSFSVILDQVNKGVAVRMALLYLLTGGSE
ncbi:MAG TPA: aspartate carbamoyltransferase catalytic subunit [Smithella sp.]|jgi:aspartate carbamoyltransferase catalytic subunit|nr:aspartate carbamoyltransferase catalytic subunit [Smithella sp.]HOS15164.1 aspartate carbamoyltransferase catalytic subunit [Smithella sp.]HPH55641.1 aspartate carbamoyltransferase catalytic subunit [Smithella sp.]